MNIQTKPEYTANDLIEALVKNISSSWNIAISDYKETPEAFNAILNASIAPAKILISLMEVQGSTNSQFKENVLKKANSDLDIELRNRLQPNNPKPVNKIIKKSHLRLVL
jgi:hypothetical protein